MLFSDLQNIVRGKTSIHQDVEVRRFATDTRTLSGSPDEVFIASKMKRDGHDYIQSAMDKGIRNFIVEKPVQLKKCNVLIVENSIETFQQIARSHREKFDIPIIGITGSNGKTTVKENLSTILAERFCVIKNPKSYNSQVGVPISVMEIRHNHEVGIFEAGISCKGEMKKLENMIQPTIGLFTTLGQAHDDGFDSHRQKLTEKLNLFVNAQKMICRSDVSFYPQIKKALGNRLVTWALNDGGDYKISWNDGTILIDNDAYKTSFVNQTDLENATSAIVMAIEMGLDHDEVQSGLNLIKPIPMRLELKKGINGCYILDDSYNNDLVGLNVALNYLELHRQNDKRTLILSDILQSGRPDEALYQQVSDLLNEKNINRLIGVGNKISACKSLFNMESDFYCSTEALLSKPPHFEKEMIVIKGARDFALERVVRVLEEQSHRTVLEVNFESLQHNLNQYHNLLSPEKKLMVMVKANAYGSGILEVANFLQHQRVDQLGVAYVDEAIRLRKNGINIPIMIMNPHIESFTEFAQYNLQAGVFSLGHFHRMLQDTNNPPDIHLKIDTGMNRLGFSEEDIPRLLEILQENPQLKVAGVFTHFSSSESITEDEFTQSQAILFKNIYHEICAVLGDRPTLHACNSSAIVRWPKYHYDMVRLGIGLHGFDPTGQMKLRPTSRLKTVISQVRQLKKGATVGYSRKGFLHRNSSIAVLPIGYEDGYLRIFGNKNANVLVKDKLCPTIGNICMDMTMVDVTGVDIKEGDEVIIFGDNPSIQQLAEWAGTIPYEILTNVSSRVKRIFISE